MCFSMDYSYELFIELFNEPEMFHQLLPEMFHQLLPEMFHQLLPEMSHELFCVPSFAT